MESERRRGGGEVRLIGGGGGGVTGWIKMMYIHDFKNSPSSVLNVLYELLRDNKTSLYTSNNINLCVSQESGQT